MIVKKPLIVYIISKVCAIIYDDSKWKNTAAFFHENHIVFSIIKSYTVYG